MSDSERAKATKGLERLLDRRARSLGITREEYLRKYTSLLRIETKPPRNSSPPEKP